MTKKLLRLKLVFWQIRTLIYIMLLLITIIAYDSVEILLWPLFFLFFLLSFKALILIAERELFWGRWSWQFWAWAYQFFFFSLQALLEALAIKSWAKANFAWLLGFLIFRSLIETLWLKALIFLTSRLLRAVRWSIFWSIEEDKRWALALALMALVLIALVLMAFHIRSF